MSVLDKLRRPPKDAPAVETFRWLRRWEIVLGIGLLVMAAILWSEEGAGRWLLLGVGVMSLSPWPGTAVLARRAEANPERFVPPDDPDELRRRKRRAHITTIVFMVVLGIPALYLGWRLGP